MMQAHAEKTEEILNQVQDDKVWFQDDRVGLGSSVFCLFLLGFRVKPGMTGLLN